MPHCTDSGVSFGYVFTFNFMNFFAVVTFSLHFDLYNFPDTLLVVVVVRLQLPCCLLVVVVVVYELIT